MAARQSASQKAVVTRVMGEFKEGELQRRDGELVTDRKQAIAIALHEAGASNRESPETNRRNLRRTRARERAAKTKEDSSPTRETLYAEAKRRGIRGRSSMNKA